MLPVQRFTHFIDAHSAFFKVIADNPTLLHSAKPVDIDGLGGQYVIFQDGFNTIHCVYEIGDRHYNRTDVLRFLKKHNNAQLTAFQKKIKEQLESIQKV